jgi:ATP/maltotriose-dependent transcriptional regulator MalT
MRLGRPSPSRRDPRELGSKDDPALRLAQTGAYHGQTEIGFLIRGLVATDRAEASKPFEPIVRSRMIERFSRATGYPITLVIAPAGYGKTVALRHYLERAQIEYIRFGLRKEHGSLLGFLRGFIATIDRIAPKAAKSLPDVYERAIASGSPVYELSNWLDVLLKKYRGTIVIDDLHVAALDPLVSELLSDLIERRADNARWILATRDPLSLPVASWLAYAQCDMPIDEVDLQLTLDEAAATVAATGAKIHPLEIQELLSLTDGWPTAFGFALRASTRTPDLKRAALGTREMVYSYLAEQVFRALSESDQQFLLETSLLPSVDLEVLSASGFVGAEAVVNRLRRSTSFIAAESESVYHYHDLFKDFLEHQLRQAGLETYRRTLRDAGLRLKKAGRADDALPLLTQALEFSEVSGILREHGAELFERGFIESVDAALMSLPPALRDSDPVLLSLDATVHAFRGQFEEADAYFTSAAAMAVDADLRSEILQRQAVSYLVRVQIARALETLERIDHRSIKDDGLRARVYATRASTLSFRGAHLEAEALVRDALSLVALQRDEPLRVFVLQHASVSSFHAARFDEAKTYIASCVRDAHRLGLYKTAARAGSLLYLIAYQACDYAECTWTLSQMKRDAERAGDGVSLSFVKINTYDLAAERGDLEKLKELDLELELFDEAAGARSNETLLPAFALRAAWASDFATAFRFLGSTADSQSTSARRALRLSEIGLYAAALGDRAAAESASKELQESIQELAESPEYETSRVVKARILFSISATLLGRVSTANNLLRDLEMMVTKYPQPLRVLLKAARAVYVHVETGAGHADMVSTLSDLRRVNLGGYARLVEALPLPNTSSSPRFSALTKTELRVLQCLAEGETSRRIAEELGRSSLTIDSHVKSIVRKLGCSGRREAIAIARSHGLVS